MSTSGMTNSTIAKPKLRPEVKAEWLRRLRSGEYQQATGALREVTDQGDMCEGDTYGYCCLGVLQTAAEEQLVPVDWSGGMPEEAVTVWSGFTTAQYGPPRRLNPEVLVPYNMVPDGEFADDAERAEWELRYPDGYTADLAHCNDTLGLTFNQIADLIEEQL